MNPPERFPNLAASEPRPPRRHDWRSLLDQAPVPPVPADFAARMQARVEREAESARAEALLVQVLILVLVAVGVAFALPGLGSGFAALLQQMGDSLPGAMAVVCAIAAAWGIDLAMRRPRGLLDV